MNSIVKTFAHRFVAGASTVDAPTLLVLHGTGGDENDFVGIGQTVLPGANILSPRGKVLENGMPRFFRRFGEGVFDIEDLKARTYELADFVNAAAGEYGFDAERVFAAGYSNGANIAASILLLRPATLAGAVLLRPMVPLVPERLPDLAGVSVLIAAGELDPIATPSQTHTLAALLRKSGADVEMFSQHIGHQIDQHDFEAASGWLTLRSKQTP